MMRVLRSRSKPTPSASSLGVVGMGLQCEECGVPTDTVHFAGVDAGRARVRVEPCNHVFTMPFEP